MTIKILFHTYGVNAHCPDGFTAAYIAWKKFGDKAEYIPVMYNENPPEFESEDEVYILDFSYPKNIFINKIQAIVKKVIVLDHHKTAQEELLGLKGALFDMNRSGAQMTWDYFFPNTKRPALIEYVADQDLWKKELIYTEEIHLARSSFIQKFEIYDALANLNEDTYISIMFEIGKNLLENKNKKLEELLKLVEIKTWQNYQIGYIELEASVAKQLSSDLGNLICKNLKVDFAVTSMFDTVKQNYKYSLRSIGEFDVSKIAQFYQGEGHKNAAGCELIMF